MRFYKNLNNQIFSFNEFRIVPIRDCDKFDIMKWRNDQIYHLRQSDPLTENDQIKYFNTTINSLFQINHPEQLLFSFLRNDKCIGYGGLVHVDWIKKKAEISFIMDTQFEKLYFEKYWSIFLRLIEEVAFKDLNFKNIFVYAFDLRKHLYDVLSKNGFIFKSRINKAYRFKNLLYDVVIYNKINIYENSPSS